jgi:hypothetical protein
MQIHATAFERLRKQVTAERERSNICALTAK